MTKRWGCILMILILTAGLLGAAAAEDTWICASCGAENQGKFCGECGAKKPDRLYCPACGYETDIDSGARFCPDCGTKLTTVPPSGSTPEPAAEPTAEPVVTHEPTPEATAEPVVTPEPTAEPTAEPVVTHEPTPEPTAEPAAAGLASAFPEDSLRWMLAQADRCASTMLGNLDRLTDAEKAAAGFMRRDSYGQDSDALQGCALIRISASQLDQIRKTLSLTRELTAADFCTPINMQFNAGYAAAAQAVAVQGQPYSLFELPGWQDGAWLLVEFYPNNCLFLLADCSSRQFSAGFVISDPSVFTAFSQEAAETYAAGLGVQGPLDMTVLPAAR